MRGIEEVNNKDIKVAGRLIGPLKPTYFIADIAANHDGSLERAKRLIDLAAKSGAEAVKFQHFRAPYIVSKRGFEELGARIAHQVEWKSSVYEVYEQASLPWEWTSALAATANDNGVAFFTAPYDLDAIDYVDDYVPAFKVGSGDITWIEAIEKMAKKGKPLFVATGASDLNDVERAVNSIESLNGAYCLMQCNTNYSGRFENRDFANLNVIKTYAQKFPNAILGLSDHTPDNFTVSTSIALGARAIEKHFTDDRNRKGPDHYFSLDSVRWKSMVRDARIIESILGDGEKRVEENEIESVIVQRRALRYKRSINQGTTIQSADLIPIRPSPTKGLAPFRMSEIIGRELLVDVEEDQLVEYSHFS